MTESTTDKKSESVFFRSIDFPMGLLDRDIGKSPAKINGGQNSKMLKFIR